MPEVEVGVVDCYVFRRTAATVEFLLLRRTAGTHLGGTWQAVHGGIEPKETAWAAARRELREETGLTPLRFWQLEFVNTFYMARRDKVMLCPSFVAEVDGAAQVVLSHEHTAHRWVADREVENQLLWPGQRQAIAEIRKLILGNDPAEKYLRL